VATYVMLSTLYPVLGPYDFVTIIEATDNATISRVSVELGARGGGKFIDQLESSTPRKRDERKKR
jgi:uncharacterized protein with GYD domain